MVAPNTSILCPDLPERCLPTGGDVEAMLIELLLHGYDDGCRYLRRAEVDLPFGRGVFKADYTFTTKKRSDVGHFSAFEHVVMFNQLAYVTFAKGFLDGYFTDLPEVALGDFQALQQYGMYILAIDRVRYVRSFPANEEFLGVLEVLDREYKPAKQLYLAHVRTEFAEGRALGEFTVALKRRDLGRAEDVPARAAS